MNGRVFSVCALPFAAFLTAGPFVEARFAAPAGCRIDRIPLDVVPVEVVFSRISAGFAGGVPAFRFPILFPRAFALLFPEVPSRTFPVFAGIAVFGEFRDRASSAVDGSANEE